MECILTINTLSCICNKFASKFKQLFSLQGERIERAKPVMHTLCAFYPLPLGLMFRLQNVLASYVELYIFSHINFSVEQYDNICHIVVFVRRRLLTQNYTDEEL